MNISYLENASENDSASFQLLLFKKSWTATPTSGTPELESLRKQQRERIDSLLLRICKFQRTSACITLRVDRRECLPAACQAQQFQVSFEAVWYLWIIFNQP